MIFVQRTFLDLGGVFRDSGGEITVSGRKLLDICRALPEGTEVHVSASGEKLGAYSLTESQAGSDPSNMSCTAEYDPETDEYVINGLKAWVTSGPNADYVILFAMTDRSQGMETRMPQA